MELLMAQLSSINEASHNGLLQESVAEHAISALLENLHQSQEKQEIKEADSEEDTAADSSEETEISPGTFEQLAPPEVEELLEIEESSGKK